jgi:predicted nucleic acid-binding protein
VIVVDASVWVGSLLSDDRHHSASQAWFDERSSRGEQFVGPTLLLTEIGGAISRRTGRIHFAHRVVEELAASQELRLVPIDEELARDGARLAVDLGLRGTDAIYVALARELGVPLVTWDREQRERAASAIMAIEPA